jgi:hypothetical protein
MTQVVEYQSSKCEALSSNPSTEKEIFTIEGREVLSKVSKISMYKSIGMSVRNTDITKRGRAAK